MAKKVVVVPKPRRPRGQVTPVPLSESLPSPPSIPPTSPLPRKRKRTQFLKYQTISDYYQDYYSSDDDELEENLGTLDLNQMVRKIDNLEDMIKICDLPLSQFKPCNRNDLIRLKKIKTPLEELNQLIGMTELKKKIIYHVLYYCQDLHNVKPPEGLDNLGDLMNMVIQGESGTGKTTLAKILGRIYLRLGILKSDRFVIAKRKDLIAEYLGQTSPKATKVFESALGGVLFIDEAYALGNEEKKDIFSKELLDCLNQFLTEHQREILVIIAGYKDSLEKCFFSSNEGLRRRFPHTFTIDNYTDKELRLILIKQIRDSGWGFANNDPDLVIGQDVIKNNFSLFNHAGGDIQIWLNKIKMAHSRNMFGLAPELKGKLTPEDVLLGLEYHKQMKEVNAPPSDDPPFGMYL